MNAEYDADRVIEGLQRQELVLGVWGCGHIGASAMYHFTRRGIRCVGYDSAPARVRELDQGRFLTTDIVPAAHLEADASLVTATTRWTDLKRFRVAVHLIAVPTERGAEPSSAVLEDIMPQICEVIRDTDVGGIVPAVIVESTIQPTWIDTVVVPALHAAGLQPGVNVLVGAAPRRDWFSGGEHTLENLPRIVGGSSTTATQLLIALYSLVCDEVVPARDAYHAAFTKVIENLMRFQGMALANSLSLAFPQYDMTHVLSLASTKWNIPYYHPSMGIGGHCIPLAPRYALAEGGPDNAYLEPVRHAVDFNDDYFSRLYHTRLRELLQDCRSVVVLGLAYTPDAKMHKLSPALDALRCLKDTPRLRIHDPYYTSEDIENICQVQTISFPDDLQDYDGIVLVTPHTAYKEAVVEDRIRSGTVIIDNFGAWRSRQFVPGVRYHEIGRRFAEDGRGEITHPEPASATTG
ncbi:MAG: UDP binding domain-containing protein [Chloroflexota bacterium]